MNKDLEKLLEVIEKLSKSTLCAESYYCSRCGPIQGNLLKEYHQSEEWEGYNYSCGRCGAFIRSETISKS